MSDLKYIITHDQFMDLLLERDLNKRTALIKAILSTPYHEKTGWEYAAGGIGQILKDIDAMTDPIPKKRGKP